jgi:hypothetical protein
MEIHSIHMLIENIMSIDSLRLMEMSVLSFQWIDTLITYCLKTTLQYVADV